MIIKFLNMKEIIITGCVDCPCCKRNDFCEGYTCELDTKEIIKEDKLTCAITPEWCPIKNNPTTIKYKEDKTWVMFSEDVPSGDYMILVTNGSFVEICYYEDGILKKPFGYDEDDTPTLNLETNKELKWKRIDLD